MQFLSDNAAAVHPAVWAAMQAADAPQPPYDNDSLSRSLDEAFSALFGGLSPRSGWPAARRPIAWRWPAWCRRMGLSSATRRPISKPTRAAPPPFFTHGAKLVLAGGENAKLTQSIEAAIPPGRDVHQVMPAAISITQASEAGCVYTPAELAAIGATARAHGLRLHMDGARFANAVAHLGCTAPAASVAGGVDALSFGCVKNGGMCAEALVYFDPALAGNVRRMRKRSGHLQSKGAFWRRRSWRC
jgi:threonine aldolase